MQPTQFLVPGVSQIAARLQHASPLPCHDNRDTLRGMIVTMTHSGTKEHDTAIEESLLPLLDSLPSRKQGVELRHVPEAYLEQRVNI